MTFKGPPTWVYHLLNSFSNQQKETNKQTLAEGLITSCYPKASGVRIVNPPGEQAFCLLN